MYATCTDRGEEESRREEEEEDGVCEWLEDEMEGVNRGMREGGWEALQ